jgi:hypothetical protein
MKYAAIALVFGVALAMCGCGAEENEKYIDWAKDDACQLVFHAVLEGLYADGVQNEVVDLIIPPGDKQFSTHFVYACPLCHPAFEAFRLYRQRPESFFGRKDDLDTFGKGLKNEVVSKLKSKEKNERLEQIRGLVTTWIARRVDSMRLNETERAELVMKLTHRLKMGMLAMESADFGAKECAICVGAVDGARKNENEKPKENPADKWKKKVDQEF